ncbi:hypothetical protein QQ045_017894 [Rhodiola kirilowii]
MFEFNDFQIHASLSDVDFIGNRFTWSNDRTADAQIWICLDRVLVNGAAMAMFPQVVVAHLLRVASVHCPLHISFGESTRRPTSFNHLRAWHSHTDFLDVVSTSCSYISVVVSHTASLVLPLSFIMPDTRASTANDKLQDLSATVLQHTEQFTSIHGALSGINQKLHELTVSNAKAEKQPLLPTPPSPITPIPPNTIDTSLTHLFKESPAYSPVSFGITPITLGDTGLAGVRFACLVMKVGWASFIWSTFVPLTNLSSPGVAWIQTLSGVALFVLRIGRAKRSPTFGTHFERPYPTFAAVFIRTLGKEIPSSQTFAGLL